MAKTYPGSIWNMTADGLEPICNVEASLNLTSDTTTEPPCKPNATDAYKGAIWSTISQTSKSWTITGTMRTVGDTPTAGLYKHAYIAEKFISGAVVQVVFGTTQTSDFDFAEVETFTGEGIVTDVTYNAPNGNESGTVDFTITGNGELTHDVVPFTS